VAAGEGEAHLFEHARRRADSLALELLDILSHIDGIVAGGAVGHLGLAHLWAAGRKVLVA